MIREVDLVSYLPPFMQTYKEPVVALEAENPEFVLVWKAADKVLKNHFISTADEYGISRFEKLLGIYPTDDDTLESRRSRIQSKWFSKLPYTLRTLIQKLTVLCGDTDFRLNHNFTVGYTLTLETDLELYGQVEELEHIINTMIPENIVVYSKNSIPCDIQGAVLCGGGICFINSFIITGDFRGVFDLDGKVAFSGGIVQTDLLTVTNDSREAVRADGDVNAASGIVHVDFIEIKTT